MRQIFRTETHRIKILDILRGVAVLGIFAINIQDMAFPEFLVLDFHTMSQTHAANFWAGISIETVFSGKMRGIFALLFGVTSVLIVERLERKFDNLQAIEIYFRRLLWLAIFGLVHSYIFLWWGEVLFKYALLGMILFSFGRASWRVLSAAMLICLAVLTIQPFVEYRELAALQQKHFEVQNKQQAVQSLTFEDLEVINRWQEVLEDIRSDKGLIEQDIQIKTGNYLDIFKHNTNNVLQEYTIIFYEEDIWDMLMYMFLGIFLLKIQYFGEIVNQRAHLAIACIGVGIGLAIHSWMNLGMYGNSLDFVSSRYYSIFFDLGRLPFVLGYISLIILFFRMDLFGRASDWMGSVGKMALSNYLIQSVIGAIIFYGFGLALFNQLNRLEIAMTIVVVWIVQVVFSVIWMGQFYHGPFEWIWRSLTYWDVQAFRRPKAGLR